MLDKLQINCFQNFLFFNLVFFPINFCDDNCGSFFGLLVQQPDRQVKFGIYHNISSKNIKLSLAHFINHNLQPNYCQLGLSKKCGQLFLVVIQAGKKISNVLLSAAA